MRWNGETWEQRCQRRYHTWQRFFALWPRQLPSGQWVWLEDLERKYTPQCGGDDVEYREVQE